jgi:hypothetical protein
MERTCELVRQPLAAIEEEKSDGEEPEITADRFKILETTGANDLTSNSESSMSVEPVINKETSI